MNRCGYCHNRGHNKATCPKLKAYIERNPDCYTARMEKRKKTYKAERKAARGPSNRVCGYCKNSGHNKRTCPKIGSDRYDTKVNNKAFRMKFMALCKKVGLAPGALMELKVNENDGHYLRQNLEHMIKRYGSLAMVVGFRSENINAHLGDPAQYLSTACEKVLKIRFPGGYTDFIKLPACFAKMAAEHYNPNWHVGCAVDAEAIEKRFTYEWKAGREGVDQMLGLIG